MFGQMGLYFQRRSVTGWYLSRLSGKRLDVTFLNGVSVLDCAWIGDVGNG